MDGQPIEEVFVYRPPSPRPWQSYGSEIEIDEVQVENTRPLIKLKCTRKEIVKNPNLYICEIVWYTFHQFNRKF